MALSLGIRWPLGLCFTWFFIQVSVEAQIQMTERKATSSVCSAGCLPGHHVNEACCEDGSTCTESDFCQMCIAGETYSDSGKENHCKNCTVCQSELNEEILKPCTEESNTECRCKLNYFRRSQLCVDCSECNEASYCKDDCRGMPSEYTTFSMEIQYTRYSVSDGLTPAVTRAKTSDKVMCQLPHCEPCSTVEEILISVFASAVFVLATIGFATKVLCCWTEKSKKFWTNYFPFFRRWDYCQPNDDPSANSSPRGIHDETNENISVICSCLYSTCCCSVQQNYEGGRNLNGSESNRIRGEHRRGELSQSDTSENIAVPETHEENIPLNVDARSRVTEGPSSARYFSVQEGETLVDARSHSVRYVSIQEGETPEPNSAHGVEIEEETLAPTLQESLV